MTRRQALDWIRGSRNGAVAALARCVLWAASNPYAGLMRLRRWGYRRGWLRSHQPAVPVISVGNITAGGTGKTPMVAWVVRQLQQAGLRPAVLTRGYMPAGGPSDEATLLEQLCRPARVIVNPDRVAGAAQAVAAGANVLVMDDGFQHLRLRRQLDIVLVDATEPFGLGYVLPRGLLREPLSALQDADAVVLTRSDAVTPERAWEVLGLLRRHTRGATFHTCIHRPTRLIAQDGAELDLSVLAGRRVLPFGGLGNPEAFFDTLGKLGADLAGTVAFDDHVRYSPADLADLQARARAAGATALVTTAKDRVKLPPAAPADLPIWTLEVEVAIIDGRQALVDRILSVHLASLQPA
jgi:tetraacyldisaccharide 4'-kinase